MAVSPATFKEILPEFAEVPSPRVQVFLDMAALSINVSAWGNKADMGQTYLAAHYLKTADETAAGDAAAGPVTQEAVGQVSASYQVGEAFSDSEYGSTAYGRRYLELRKTVFACRCL
jgi:hypothetical protein